MKEAVASMFVMFSVCTCIQKAHSMNHTTTVGQDVLMPCGINSVENVTRLAWKFGQSASDSVQLAFSFEGVLACDRSKKDCELRDNGDLIIHNVKEVDSNDRYFCFLNDEKYYAEHTLNILPRASPPNFEKCPDAVSVSKPDHLSQRLLAYTTPICRNSEDVLGSVTCTPPSGTKIDSSLNKIVCNCTYSQVYSDTCEMTIPVLPPSFEDCPVPNGVSVSKLDDSSLMLLAYTPPVCRNSEEVLGIVTCSPKSGAKISSNYNRVVCNCTYSGDHSDTCEMPIPADRSEPVCAKITGQGFAIGFGVCAISCAIGGATVLFIWCFMRSKRQSSNASPHSSSQNKLACCYKRANKTEGRATFLQGSKTTNQNTIIRSPTDAVENGEDTNTQVEETTQEDEVTQERVQLITPEDTNTQVEETTQEDEVTQERVQLITPADRQTTETTQASGVQPDSAPVPAQANIQQEEITQDPGVQPKTEPLAIPENRRPRLSSTKVTSPPQFRNHESGYDTVDLPEDTKAVTMEELMLDFDSGPQIKLLPLKEILSDGMEIRSFSDNCFKVIRKSEEEQDVPLTCRKDGHHWYICSGDQSCFYVSCGYCHKGCLLVGISGGKPTHKGQ